MLNCWRCCRSTSSESTIIVLLSGARGPARWVRRRQSGCTALVKISRDLARSRCLLTMYRTSVSSSPNASASRTRPSLASSAVADWASNAAWDVSAQTFSDGGSWSDILLEDFAQCFAIRLPGSLVPRHGHRLAQELLGDLLAPRQLHQSPHLLAEGLQAHVGRLSGPDQCGDVVGGGVLRGRLII